MQFSLPNAWSATKRVFLSLWKFFVGGVVAAVAFYGNFVDLRQPNVSIEITEIQQKTSADIDVKSSPLFTKFRELMSGDFDFRYSRSFGDVDILKELQLGIDRMAQRIADNENILQGLKTEAEKIHKSYKPIKKTDEKSSPIEIFGLYDRLDESILNEVSYAEAKKRLESIQQKIENKKALLKLAQNEVRAFREKSEKTDAKIIVTAAITNSGDGATTLKPQALLRTDLGQGNYLDINLKIANYEKGGSEIKPRGASIVIFESPPISYMAPQDQERFLSFFKNTSPTNLYIGDVRNNYYKSNTIPFAQGIYEQKIFDGLKRFATGSGR